MQAKQEDSFGGIKSSIEELNQLMSQNKDITAITLKVIEQLDRLNKNFNRMEDSKAVIGNMSNLYETILPLAAVTYKYMSQVNDFLKKMAQVFSAIEDKRRKVPIPSNHISKFNLMMITVNSVIGNGCFYSGHEELAVNHYENGHTYLLKVEADSNLPTSLKDANINSFYSMYYPLKSRFLSKKGLQQESIELANKGRLFYHRAVEGAKVVPGKILIESYSQIAKNALEKGYLEESLYYFNEARVIIEETLNLTGVTYTMPLNGKILEVSTDQEKDQVLKLLESIDQSRKAVSSKLLEKCQQYISQILNTNGVKSDCHIQEEEGILKVHLQNDKFAALLREFLTKHKFDFSGEAVSQITIKINISVWQLQKIFVKFVKHLYESNAFSAPSDNVISKRDPSDSPKQEAHDNKEEKSKHHQERKKHQFVKLERPKKGSPNTIEVQWHNKNYKPLGKDDTNKYFRIYGDPNVMTYGFFNNKTLLAKVPNQFTLDRGKTVAERGLVIPSDKSLGRQGIVFAQNQALTKKFSDNQKQYICKVKLNGVLVDDRFLGRKVSKGTLKINGESQQQAVELIEFDEYVHKAHKVANI